MGPDLRYISLKKRGMCGPDFEPYEAILHQNADKILRWEVSEVHSEKLEKRQAEKNKVLELKAQSKIQQEIVSIVDISIGKVNKLLKT